LRTEHKSFTQRLSAVAARRLLRSAHPTQLHDGSSQQRPGRPHGRRRGIRGGGPATSTPGQEGLDSDENPDRNEHHLRDAAAGSCRTIRTRLRLRIKPFRQRPDKRTQAGERTGRSHPGRWAAETGRAQRTRRIRIGPRAVEGSTTRPPCVISTTPLATSRLAADRAGSINARHSSPPTARAASLGQIVAPALRASSSVRTACSSARSVSLTR